MIGRLGTRRLVWAGIRGDDIEPLADLPQLDASFTIINRYARRSSINGLAYEDLSGRRVDMEVWDIDEHLDAPETHTFREGLLRTLAKDSALLPYRPSRFLSAIAFVRRDRCVNLGLFGAHQNAFEHKPWVESSVADLGIPCVPWTYLADEEQVDADRLLADGPVLLRRSRTSGGEGIVRVDTVDELRAQWPRGPESFVSVAPYLEDALPLNVGATVWAGGISVHRPSVQLIGIPSCVGRPFGYSGNDFGLVSQLDPVVFDLLEDRVKDIGTWMSRHGYRGTFGVDFLLHRGQLLFTEINPRFQGSTHLSSQLSIDEGEPCLMLEHVAEFLDVPMPTPVPLRERMRDRTDVSHLVVHWLGDSAQAVDARPLADDLRSQTAFRRTDILAPVGIVTEPGAAVIRTTFDASISVDGYSIDPGIAELVVGWTTSSRAPGDTRSKENSSC